VSIGTTAPATGLTVFGCGPDEAALFRTIAPRFGVRPTVTEAPVSERNAELARGNRCVSVGHQTPVTNPTLRALSRTGVEYVSTRSVGHDHIDVDYAQRVGVTVGTVAYSPDSVADYTLMLILMALRHTGSVIRRADARDYRLHDTPGRELRDLTVGVVGTGRIGSAVLDRLAGFGCRTLAHDRRQSTAARYLPLDDLLRHSDVVTLHTPLDAGTRHLLGRRRIALMKSDAVLVNTGRGALVDTGALLCALESGRLGGAALDVVEGEQGIFYADCRDRVPQNIWLERLQRLPNVLVTPHTAFHTDRAVRDTVESTLVSCLEFESEKRHG
jgi:D-specific alpha-keto acid dehydrogenase